MDSNTKIDKIKLPASAYYFKIKDGARVDSAMWEHIQNTIKSHIVKPAYNFYAKDWKKENIDGEQVNYGLCVFRYHETIPSYANEIDDYWTERKLGYFVIVEYNQYVATQYRNIEVPRVLLNILSPIDYPTLTSLNNNSSYSKISMKNLNGGANAMRARTFIADDLSKSMSALGANHYMLTAFNGKNNSGKTFAVTTSTARIAERAQDLSIREYSEWVKETIINISRVNQNVPTDFLSVFAEYVDYKVEKQAGRLIPSSILFSTWDIYDKLDTNQCTLTYKFKGNDSPITLADLMTYLEKVTSEPILLSLKDDAFADKKHRISIKLKEDNIVVDGLRLKNVQISSQQEPDFNGSLARLINKYGLFNIYFENNDVIYTQSGLYKNHNLLGNYKQLLGVFQPLTELNAVTTEKHHNGHIFDGLESWADDSIFKVVEDIFHDKFDHLICDDLEEEWADHIGISEKEISFFVEKCNDSQYSASAFQEVVGQALKNIGNLTPLDDSLAKKRDVWDGCHTKSHILRWRNKKDGQTMDEVINLWKNNRTNPNCIKEMCLVVNFISADEFKRSLSSINNLNNKEKAATFQRLWILSSFINACIEASVKPIIYCKP